MGNLGLYEVVAAWLAGVDGNKIKDDELAECIALAFRMKQEKTCDVCLDMVDMWSVDPDEICNKLREYLKKALFSQEISPECWWKKEMKSFIQKLDAHYDKFYKAGDNYHKEYDYAAALAFGDQFIKEHYNFMCSLVRERGDVISSDREVVAMAYALADGNMDYAEAIKKKGEASKQKQGLIGDDSDGIVIEGHIGSWYVIESTKVVGNKLYLLEHETYGDEAAGLIVDENGNIILEDVWNGFDDLWENIHDVDLPDPKWDEALESVSEGYTLSPEIGYGLSDDDLRELASLHKKGKHCQKIEEVLEDCNFHQERADFIEHNYDKYLSGNTEPVVGITR